MRRVLYLHGLESNQGGPKVEFLYSIAFVHAPAMECRTKNWTLDKLIDLANNFNPDLIIGSSMGGYFADVLGSHTGIETLLFNPALHSRPMDYNFTYGKDGYKRTIVLGEDDTVVIPERTKEIVGDTAEIVEVQNMGHRTPLDTFKAIYSKYILNETS